ncbi:Diacylglycerol kinase [Exophiala xenobiotica]|uniref:Diacylglycerol kinase n=1 Tax=Vermiconidia calcicola TaxID=1690605 RepID=A0AAV9PTJ0_9PEZI|nr:Diacylglycerol kinase [Exophiala xenobiotica]KAK5529202.1 Diacylglycerol kinase [Vermiconidia calcicola]KAK5547167.1 Diacylglycerol kinase [Chaetothyriales sp. CCFEE 6169]KAK5190658.1 Diacylglycerol kinase [Exophiala xenobiotica]KAK5203694.1 Diacylglycerol kinase [Exophiala xenobiotica]
MSYQYPIPATPRVISPSPTPSETSERQDSYFAPVTRSAAKAQRQRSPQPEPINEEKDGSGSDSSVEKRARTRSRSPILSAATYMNGSASAGSKRRRMSGLTTKTPVKKSEPLTNGADPLAQPNGHLSPYDRVKKSWREFSRSPSPLGLIPLHRHYRNLIHKHEIPRKLLHVSIGFTTLRLYVTGMQTPSITPWLAGALAIIGPTDVLRHHSDRFNRFYIRVLGALMRETEVDGYNGVIWYLIGAYISLKFYPKDIGVVSILLLSWCDTAASTFGRLYGRYTIRLRRGKSLAGSLAAFVTGALVAIFFWGYLAPRTGSFPDDPINAYMFQDRLSLPSRAKELLGWQPNQGVIVGNTALAVMSVCTGIIASFSEFIDLWGWDDNLTIPLLSSAGLWAFLKVFG